MRLDAEEIAETLQARAEEIRNQEMRELVRGDLRGRKEILLYDPLTNISVYLGIGDEQVSLCTTILPPGRKEEIVKNQMTFKPTGVILRRNNRTVYFFRESEEGIEILEVRSNGFHLLGLANKDYLNYLRLQATLPEPDF